MEEVLFLTVDPQDHGARLDKALCSGFPDMSRSALQRLIEQGGVLMEGRSLAKGYRVSAGDRLEVHLPEPVPLDVKAEEIPLEIPYEDEDLLVVNKPKGMVVHPAVGNYTGTLVNALLAHCGDSLSGINGVASLSGINGVARPGIVHRIDKDTSGLLVVAKNDFSHQKLAEQIKSHDFTRLYEAVAYGHLKDDDGTVDAPIGRHPENRKKMAVTQKNSRNAVTHYHVLARYPGFSHLRLRLETGRTHQIRVHMAYLGHPLAGDSVYGPKKGISALGGQCLHAKTLGFRHPRTGEYLEFTSNLPQYFTEFLGQLEKLI